MINPIMGVYFVLMSSSWFCTTEQDYVDHQFRGYYVNTCKRTVSPEAIEVLGLGLNGAVKVRILSNVHGTHEGYTNISNIIKLLDVD